MAGLQIRYKQLRLVEVSDLNNARKRKVKKVVNLITGMNNYRRNGGEKSTVAEMNMKMEQYVKTDLI